MHAVTCSRVFGFFDDLEFHLPENEGVIHYRAAARTGGYDSGVNRTCIDRIIDQVAGEDDDAASED